MSKGHDGDASVKVVCRFRPPNKFEEENGGKILCKFPDETTVSFGGGDSDVNTFHFDRVFGMSTTQDEMYSYGGKLIIQDVLEGFNGTIFAYGQTSSGKSHTMMGPDGVDGGELRGLIPRMVEEAFKVAEENVGKIEYTFKVSYFEIYLEQIRDLLNPTATKLAVRENKARGVFVQGLREVDVSSAEEVYHQMRVGAANRKVSATNMNAVSSRSHSLFQMSITVKNMRDLSMTTGQLTLIDLAGSEKVGKTGATGSRLDEAKNINSSLTALGKVITALTDGSKHIPYRDSKLTRCLTESLGGNARTLLVINCSPSEYNESETISTLRFGMRAKTIKNKAKINAQRTVEELELLVAQYEKTIEQQKTVIAALEEEVHHKGGAPSATPAKGVAAAPGDAPVSSVSLMQQRIHELEEKLALVEEENAKLMTTQNDLMGKLSAQADELTAAKNQVSVLEGQRATWSMSPEKASEMEALKKEVLELRAGQEAMNKERKVAVALRKALKAALDKQKDWERVRGAMKEELDALQAQHDKLKVEQKANIEALHNVTNAFSVTSPDGAVSPAEAAASAQLAGIAGRVRTLRDTAARLQKTRKLSQAQEALHLTVQTLRAESDALDLSGSGRLGASQGSLDLSTGSGTTPADLSVSTLLGKAPMDEVKSDYAKAVADLEHLNVERAALEATLAELKEKASAATEEARVAQENRDEFVNALASLEDERMELTENVDRLRREMDDFTSLREKLELETLELRRSVAALTTEAAEAKALHSQRDALRAEVDKLQDEKGRINLSLSVLEASKTDAEKQQQQLDSLLRSISETKTAMNAEIKGLEDQRAKSTAELKPLQDELLRLAAENSGLETTVVPLRTEVSSLTAEKSTLSGQVASLKAELTNMQTALQAERETFKETLSSLRLENDALQREKQITEQDVTALQGSRRDLTAFLESLRNEFAAHRAENEALTERLVAAQSQMSSIAKEKATLEKAVADLKKEHADLAGKA